MKTAVNYLPTSAVGLFGSALAFNATESELSVEATLSETSCCAAVFAAAASDDVVDVSEEDSVDSVADCVLRRSITATKDCACGEAGSRVVFDEAYTSARAADCADEAADTAVSTPRFASSCSSVLPPSCVWIPQDPPAPA